MKLHIPLATQLLIDDWFAIQISLTINTPPLCHIFILACATIIHARSSSLQPLGNVQVRQRKWMVAHLGRSGVVSKASRLFLSVLPLLIVNTSISLVLCCRSQTPSNTFTPPTPRMTPISLLMPG
jgi:hypothetical protein